MSINDLPAIMGTVLIVAGLALAVSKGTAQRAILSLPKNLLQTLSVNL
jgi:hypothetical protein